MAEDKVESTMPPSVEHPRKKRTAFWSSLIAGLYLMTLALATAVYTNASSIDLLTEGVRQNVDLAAVGLDEDSAETFALRTLSYLQGNSDEWDISQVVGESILPIPEAFMAHMANVRYWFAPADTLLFMGRMIVLLALPWVLLGVKRGRKVCFSLKGYYTGALILLVFIAGMGVWSVLDFQGMWHLLHKVIIPDGIFSAAEPIMQLFPLQLFAGYAEPVFTAFGIISALLLIAPLIWGMKAYASNKEGSPPHKPRDSK